MESKLSAKNIKVLSNTVVTVFSLLALLSFLFTIDRTNIVSIISLSMLCASLYLMWFLEDFDAISLLIFFFGTTACFYFFSNLVIEDWPKAIAVAGFAILSFVLSNYLLNLIRPFSNPSKIIYKVLLAIIFTETFWVISLMTASQISKGAISAVIFFNFQSIVRDILSGTVNNKRFALLGVISILLLAIVFYRI